MTYKTIIKMANYFNLPLVLPFKFVKNGNTGMHFDDQWACDQIRFFERRVFYVQPWNKAETTMLQCESTVPPEDMQLRNRYNGVVKTFEWVKVVEGFNYAIYNLVYDVSDVDNGVYFLYTRAQFMDSINWEWISEPIDINVSHDNTKSIVYKNSYNRDDVAWTTGLVMRMRAAFDVQDFEPGVDFNSNFIDQMRTKKILDGIAYRKFKFYIGDAPGVAPYVVDILNRIWLNDYVSIENKLYVSDEEEIRVTRVRGYPLIGGALNIAEGLNSASTSFAEENDTPVQMVTSYNIKTTFFGPVATVPVIQVLH
jgi:hypothetical protein